MFQKLDQVEKRFEQVNQSLLEPGVADNQTRYRGLMKELADLEEVVEAYRRYKKVRQEVLASKELVANEHDADMREMAREELALLTQEQGELEQRLKILLLPKDPNDDKNIILEMRAGAGGDEASLFVEELFRAYTHYAAKQGWRVEVISTSEGNVGGYKEAIAHVTGEKVYSLLKYESGVHRVQRVPKTESQGRVHTSTITVAVLPEAEEVDVQVDAKDLRIDVMRASGAGGQSVNRTESAVRVTHIPTGTVVYCQEGKSQLSNKEKALKILYSRLLAMEEERARKEASDARIAQIGTGDRSERIRTYNFPQSRITDHRIGLTTHSINEIMSGDLNPIIEPLVAHYQAEALKRQAEQ